MFKNQLELSIADWLWEVWNNNPDAFSVPFKEGNWEDVKKIDIDNGGCCVVVKATDDFALVYRNNGQVPSEEELTEPLPDDYFTDDGDWDDEAVWNKLNQFATLVEIYRI
jgi:hypothetical protein